VDGVERGLVGRSAECDRIARALESSAERRSVTLVLRGAPGVGKTRLLYWTIAHSGDCTVLRASGSVREMHQPFALLDTLLRQARPTREAVEHPDRSAQFVQLADGDVPADRFKVAMVVFEVLSALAEERPVLVAVDDAQWADESSLDALLLARSRLESDACAIVLARRDGEPCALDGQPCQRSTSSD